MPPAITPAVGTARGLDGLRREWTLAFVGMGGGALMGATAVAPGILLILLVPAWTAALLAMGWAQWLVLRRAVPRSGRWVPVTSGAWSLGVTVPVIGLTITPNAWPVWAHVGVAVVCAVVMGLIVGLLTGRTLQQLLARDDRLSADGGGAGPSALPRWRPGVDDDVSDRGDRGGEQPAAVGTP